MIFAEIGYNHKDYGYLCFKYVRIPRSGLLSRHSQIDNRGEFSVLF